MGFHCLLVTSTNHYIVRQVTLLRRLRTLMPLKSSVLKKKQKSPACCPYLRSESSLDGIIMQCQLWRHPFQMHLTPEIFNSLQNSIEHPKGTFVEYDDFPNFPFGWDILAHSPGRETTSSPFRSVSSQPWALGRVFDPRSSNSSNHKRLYVCLRETPGVK